MNEPLQSSESTSEQDLLRAYLAGRDIPCPLCGYNLRDLIGHRCPECGDEIVLRVNMAEPRQRALIAGLIGLSAGAGLNGLLLIYGIVMVLNRPRRMNGMEAFLTVNLFGFLVQGAGLALWLGFWRRIRRLSPAARLILMISCFLLTLINLAVFTLNIE